MRPPLDEDNAGVQTKADRRAERKKNRRKMKMDGAGLRDVQRLIIDKSNRQRRDAQTEDSEYTS